MGIITLQFLDTTNSQLLSVLFTRTTLGNLTFILFVHLSITGHVVSSPPEDSQNLLESDIHYHYPFSINIINI